MDTEQALISKKALLARYGISYGSLYRWKRMGLIPDEWFLRKATVTGQETFFPEALICERVERILATKEEVLLHELAERFYGENQTEPSLSVETAYGTRTFRMQELRRVTMTDRNGKASDITETIKNLMNGGLTT